MASSSNIPKAIVPRDGAVAFIETQWPQEQLHLAIEAAGLAVWEIDLASRVVRTSPMLARLLGHDGMPAVWTLKHFEDGIFPDDVGQFRDALAAAMTQGELNCDIRMRRAEGRLGWITLSGRLATDEHGRPLRLTGVLQDITDRKGSEQFMLEREAQFSAMFDASSVGMAQADPFTGRLVRVNACLCQMLGYSPEQLVGRRLPLLTHPEDRDANADGLQRLVKGEIPTFSIEKRMLRRGGATVWVLLTVNLISDASGQPMRLTAVVIDITERKRAERALIEREEELRQTRRRLEERVEERTTELAEANTSLQVEIAERRLAEQQVRELLGRQVQAVEEERSRISRELHDTLGQHLAVLAIELKSIEEHERCTGTVRERVSKVQKAVRLIEDELDRLSYELRPLALDDLGLDDALRSHAATWSQETGVAAELHTHGLRTGRLPALIETTVYRVVQEALTNVRKHAGASRVGVIVERRLDELRVVIDDDGCGFDAAAVSPQSGRQLGLRGMAERARLVGGRLEIESVPGRGTTIYLAIPVRPDVSAEETVPARR